MVMPSLRFCTVLFLALLFTGCGHSQTSRIALISFGDLEGKSLPDKPDGPSRHGITGGAKYYLSDAVRDALKDSEYDTLLDVEVTAETGLFVWSNTLAVEGTALNSKKLEHLGGTR
jgi:hypothetical protein